jgi:hypothetical protein
MTVSFTADKIEFGLKWGGRIFNLRGQGHYLWIERGWEYNKLGKIHFECDGQGYGGYDVIRSISLEGNFLVVELIPEAAEDFDDRLRYVVTVNFPEKLMARARKCLKRMVRGTAISYDRS